MQLEVIPLALTEIGAALARQETCYTGVPTELIALLGSLAALALEAPSGINQQFTLPLADLGGVDLEPCGKL